MYMTLVYNKQANMSQLWDFAVFFLFFVRFSLGEEPPIIETSLGKVRGQYQLSYGSRKFAAFEGIPYAKPPIGDLRFEQPLEAEPWTGILNATTTHKCIQTGWGTGQSLGSEDCLYLNVYVPKDKLNDKSNLDVLINIHGGAFRIGESNLFGPGYLMDRNVVYASMNYRLGAMGFLSTEDHIVSGNMGLKDQVMALRWVQKHIKSFGGNPNSVTLTGLSAGAASVHFHYFSPLSKGLFHRGMSQGGTALAPWAIHKAPLEKTKRLAASVGCDSPSTKELVECLKQTPASRLVQNLHDSPIDGFPLTPFSPVIEVESPTAFITGYPYNLLKSGNIADIPWITGTTTEEGILGIFTLKFQYDKLNKHWNMLLPYILNYEYTANESDKSIVAQKIKKFYLDGNEVTEENVQSLIKLFSDRWFHLDLEKSARLQAKVVRSPIYSYVYGYHEDSNIDESFGVKKDYGVSHGNDGYLLYIMKFAGITFSKGKLSESDEKIKELLVDFITSFAKNGKPISEGTLWDPVTNSSDFRYLFIKNDEIKMVSKTELSPTQFWQSLPLKEYDNFVSKKR